MPKLTSKAPAELGGWRYMRPKVEALANEWPRKIKREALKNGVLMGPVFMAAIEPEKLSAQGIAQFWAVYALEPDWILAVMQLMRSEIVRPKSARSAITAMLHKDWMHDQKPQEVIEAVRREFPAIHIPKDFKASSSVENARSTIRRLQRKLK